MTPEQSPVWLRGVTARGGLGQEHEEILQDRVRDTQGHKHRVQNKLAK